MMVTLAEIVLLDPTLTALADLPVGWEAVRGHVGDPWRRSTASSDGADG
jgi:hypothetical protein